jgi:tripartite-type tricarboxylate transporter receptor subunit TctC
MRRQAWILGLVTAAGLVFGGSAHSQDAAEFYKGKTLTWIVATGPGGGHDFYARLIIKHMAKQMPETTLVVKNVRAISQVPIRFTHRSRTG